MLAFSEILCYDNNVIWNATQVIFGGVMNNNKNGHNQLTVRPSVASGEREVTNLRASALAAAKAVHHQQIALLVKQTLTTSVVEPCLSPLLWSESFRLRLDG